MHILIQVSSMKTTPLVKPPQSSFLKASKVLLSPGEEVGEHVTENREEIILVLKGEGILMNGRLSIPLKEGQVHHVGENTLHNVKNTSSSDLEYVYVVSFGR
jgi:mannose-6-phosphate isomerase-like protein (cupin superfamily)